NGASPSPNPLSETLALRELEDQQAGWRYVLAGVLGLLLLETLLARRSAPLPGGSP
ncbi:MAG: hypothetical protein RLZZ244_1600, partial [Verrucomicrobiota bacterium]